MIAAVLTALAGGAALYLLRRRVVRTETRRLEALAAHHRHLAGTRPTVRIIEGDRRP